jgi:RNA polymerase sigma-70 factor (ECF subfamily)
MKTGAFRRATPEKGRFRSFLLGALRLFLADDIRRRMSQKAGGHLRRCELDDDAAITVIEESEFDREWAQSVLDRALGRLEAEILSSRGPAAWPLLRTFLPGSEAPAPYAALAGVLGLSEGGAKTEVSRLRRRFREAIRREVARTVSTPQEIEDELAHLRQAMLHGLHPA